MLFEMPGSQLPVDILVLGDAASSKSSLIALFSTGNETSQEPYVDAIYSVPHFAVAATLNVLDAAPTGYVEKTRAHQINEAQAIIFVYSICSHESYQFIRSQFKKVCAARLRQPQPPIVLLGTFTDNLDTRAVSFDMGMRLALEVGADFFLECIATMEGEAANAIHHLISYLSKPAVALEDLVYTCIDTSKDLDLPFLDCFLANSTIDPSIKSVLPHAHTVPDRISGHKKIHTSKLILELLAIWKKLMNSTRGLKHLDHDAAKHSNRQFERKWITKPIY